MSDYDTLMAAVSAAREESRAADKAAREARKRAVEAERAFVDWMVGQNAARPAERAFAERISRRVASENGEYTPEPHLMSLRPTHLYQPAWQEGYGPEICGLCSVAKYYHPNHGDAARPDAQEGRDGE